jgi:hypothetical protein
MPSAIIAEVAAPIWLFASTKSVNQRAIGDKMIQINPKERLTHERITEQAACFGTWDWIGNLGRVQPDKHQCRSTPCTHQTGGKSHGYFEGI